MSSEQLAVSGEQLATAVPDAALQAALTAYENARADGLCHEGAWECAVTAVQTFDLKSPTDNDQLLDLLKNQIKSQYSGKK